MTTTISSVDGTVTPTLVTEYAASQASQTIIHAILGQEEAAYTLQPDTMRRGSLALFFETEAAAYDARTKLSAGRVYTLADTDRPVLNMRFVRDGQLAMQLDAESRAYWLVSVDYAEVAGD
jgi:hypothetical protein